MVHASKPGGVAATPLPEEPPAGRGAPRRRWRRAAIPVLLALCVAFLAVELPAYLGFDPAASRVPIRQSYPLHYPLLVAHILFGSVALVAGCLQIWPLLRRRHPVLHRWTGRVYLFGGVFPAGIAVLGVAPVSSTGFVSAVGNTMLAVLWLVTSIAGYRAARGRRFGEHRAWMVRSFALTLSIVVNRVWLVLFIVLLAPATSTLYGGDEAAMIQAAAGASVWTSWVVNLLVAEWWLQRRPRRGARGPRARAA